MKKPPKTVPYKEPSQLSNPKTERNISTAEGRAKDLKRGHDGVVGKVTDNAKLYYSGYHDRHVARQGDWDRHYHDNHFRYYYSNWYRHGFYGGYWYPVRPCYDIHLYFWYPILYWFYMDSWDPDYYRVWYPDYDGYVVPFKYARVFYPSDTFRDLGIEVSAMSIVQQMNFREDLVQVVDTLAQTISDNLESSIVLSDNDIVINHYENLEDQAIVIEGFVDRDDLHLAFKALLDLNDTTQTLVFAPVNQEPTDSDLITLQTINDRIQALGGDPYTAAEEPETASYVEMP